MSNKETYKISVHGCDDSTIFAVELTSAEYETVKRIAEKCTATSTYGCMPVMEIHLNNGDSNDE